jgi:hypothetical protein
MAYDLSSQNLLTMVQTRLGGKANSVTSDQLLDFLNSAKDELWSILKQEQIELFTTKTQAVDSTQTTYFAPLLTNTREYTLPFDVRDILFIEVTAPIGYELVKFTRRSILHPDFRTARTSASAFQNQGGSIPLVGIIEYFYDIVGKNTFVLAQFPETTFTLTIWYVRALPDFTLGASTSPIDEIIFPFHKKLVDYATMLVMLRGGEAGFAAWKTMWIRWQKIPPQFFQSTTSLRGKILTPGRMLKTRVLPVAFSPSSL